MMNIKDPYMVRLDATSGAKVWLDSFYEVYKVEPWGDPNPAALEKKIEAMIHNLKINFPLDPLDPEDPEDEKPEPLSIEELHHGVKEAYDYWMGKSYTQRRALDLALVCFQLGGDYYAVDKVFQTYYVGLLKLNWADNLAARIAIKMLNWEAE